MYCAAAFKSNPSRCPLPATAAPAPAPPTSTEAAAIAANALRDPESMLTFLPLGDGLMRTRRFEESVKPHRGCSFEPADCGDGGSPQDHHGTAVRAGSCGGE